MSTVDDEEVIQEAVEKEAKNDTLTSSDEIDGSKFTKCLRNSENDSKDRFADIPCLLDVSRKVANVKTS